MLPTKGKVYDYVNLKRLASSFYPPGTMSTQIDTETLKKEHKDNVKSVLFSVDGVKTKPKTHFVSKRHRLQRKPYNMPSKAYLAKMWDKMPTLQENRMMQGCGLIGYCPNQHCKNY